MVTATVTDVIDETPGTRTLVLDVRTGPASRGPASPIAAHGDDLSGAAQLFDRLRAEDSQLAITGNDRGWRVSPYLAGRCPERARGSSCAGRSADISSDRSTRRTVCFVAGDRRRALMQCCAIERMPRAMQRPFYSIRRARRATSSIAELDALAAKADGLKVVHTLTRERPAGWRGGTRRIDRHVEARQVSAERERAISSRPDAAGRGRGGELARSRPRNGTGSRRTFRPRGWNERRLWPTTKSRSRSMAMPPPD